MRLENKVALITGGGTGIGKATAILFAEEGAKVVVTGLDQQELDDVSAAIQQAGGEALALQQDVTEEGGWDTVVSQTLKTFGQLNVLVNNAGIALIGNAEHTSLDEWEKTQAVNSTGVFLGVRAAIKAMKNNAGSIINISSVEGIVGEPSAAAYNASKGAVRIYSKSAALYCTQQGYNIRVNSLHPGAVETPMMNGLGGGDTEVGNIIRQTLIGKTPIGRLAAPREMATGILFLASDDSSYMTGAELVMDGGMTAQ
jgi:NAD(P)-dependent dehydrogenase (short-subunit alcohol dehydrogenase family)